MPEGEYNWKIQYILTKAQNPVGLTHQGGKQQQKKSKTDFRREVTLQQFIAKVIAMWNWLGSRMVCCDNLHHRSTTAYF